MNALSSSDRHLVDQAREILASADDIESFADRCLNALAVAVDADLFAYNDVNLDTGEARFVLKPGRPPGTAGTAPFLRRFGYHPAATSIFPSVAGQGIPRFVSDPKLRSLGVGNCCGDAEMNLNAGLDLSAIGARRIGIGVSRAIRDFDDRDRAVLEGVRALLVEALRAAHPSAPPMAARTMPLENGPKRLTRRENEVLYWVAMGKTNSEIATIVGAKPMTVKKHLEHVYEKLEVPNRTSAAAAARVSGLQTMRLVLPTAKGA